MRTYFLILLSIIICGNVNGQRVTQIDSVAFYKQRPKVYYDANAEYQLSASMGDGHAYQDTIVIPTRDSLYKFISYTEDYNELFGLYREIPKYRNYRSIVYLSYNWLDTYYVNLTNNRVFFFYGITCRYGNKLLSVNRNSSDRRAYIGIYKINGDSIKELWSISPQNLDIYNIKEVYLRTKYVYIYYEGLEAKYYVKIDTTFPLPSLGNIRETYIHPEAGYKECIQRMQYYPSGLPWIEAMQPSEQPWKYNGKEFVEMHGLDEYDSKARWYYPAICRTTTMDPLAEKYYSTSPYAWCGNNPIIKIDPDGRIVIAVDEVAQNRILGTLSYTERGYVNFNKNGQLNIDRLNLYTSTSHNMNALKALTKSEVTYNFLVQDKSSNGQTDMKRAGGVTEMYGAESNPSPDPMLVTIISGDHLVGEDAVRNMAHEAFGHAYMYEIKNKDAYEASHHYKIDLNKSYIGNDGNFNLVTIDTNTELQEYINKATTEALENYNDKR